MTTEQLEQELMNNKKKEAYRNLHLLNIFINDIGHDEDYHIQDKCRLSLNMLEEIAQYIDMLERRNIDENQRD